MAPWCKKPGLPEVFALFLCRVDIDFPTMLVKYSPEPPLLLTNLLKNNNNMMDARPQIADFGALQYSHDARGAFFHA